MDIFLVLLVSAAISGPAITAALLILVYFTVFNKGERK